MVKRVNKVKNLVGQGNYSVAVSDGKYVYISGQLPVDIETGALKLGTAKEETLLILNNVEEILKEFGTNKSNILKTTVFMTNDSYWGEMNEAFGEFFGKDLPARSAIGITPSAKGFKVEIDIVAVI